MAFVSGRGVVCALGAGAVLASSASGVVLHGSWTMESGVYLLPDAASAAELNQFIVDAFPIFEQGAIKAAALAGQQAAQSARITYATYPSDSTWHGPAGILGELTITLTYSALSTGGAQDIATGGEYIDKQLAKQQKHAEFAQVDVDKEVWRQDFGQIKADRHEVRSGETLEFAFRGLVEIPAGALDLDALGHTEVFTIDFSVVDVPGPGASALMGIGMVCLATRRRRG